MNKRIRITFIASLFLTLSIAGNSQNIAIWQSGNTKDLKNGSQEFIKTISTFYQVKTVTSDDLKKAATLQDIQILRLNASDTLPFSSPSLLPFSKKAIKNIRSFVSSGGSLLLTNQAGQFINFLNIEPATPQTRIKSCKDEGYGRMLGFHSLRGHPLFDGLHGGVYCLKPEMDTTVLQTGYFEGTLPENGKVIAVDWDYIFLREEKKMIVEWEYGEGKVLMIGGYLLFDIPNRNMLQMEKFTDNIVKYLAGVPGTPEHYWYYGPYGTGALKWDGTIQLAGPKKWEISPTGLDLEAALGVTNYLESAGERILAMGDYLGGIREVWSHPFLSIRDLYASIRFEGQENPLPLNNLAPRVTVTPWGFIRTYTIREAELKEVVAASPDEPHLVIHYEYSGNEPMEVTFQFRTNMRLMWPYSHWATGNIGYTWDGSSNAFIMLDRTGEMVSIFATNKSPEEVQILNPLTGSDTELPGKIVSDTLLLEGLIKVWLAPSDEMDIIHIAGTEGLMNAVSELKPALDPYEIFRQANAKTDNFLEDRLTITSPSDEFNTGYEWSMLATDRFFATTPGIGSSLVAGYATSDKGWDGGHTVSGRPGYGWYFGRDGVWSGLALLDYGDFEKVRAMLELFISYQDLDGKIFHELSTSGFVHYDAADATPLFLVLAGRYLQHSGDVEFIRENWHAVRQAADYCYSTDTDGDLLIENTNVGHGWVEGGSLFGSHTSLYLASCWAEALNQLSYMSMALDSTKKAVEYSLDSRQVALMIDKDFWNRKRNFYYHGLFRDGTFHEEPTIMPAIPMLFRQADPKKAGLILPVFASNVFSSDWGCRIVGENSPLFNPNGYHTGSVWPLFTGWAALAEFQYGKCLQGFSHLMNNLLIYRHWGLGYLEEVLNGEVYKPSGVCHHQCWSQTMVQQPAIEGMLGFRPDAIRDKMFLNPWFPADWDSVSVENLRIGNHLVNVRITSSPFQTTYRFEHSGESSLDVEFNPLLPPGTEIDSVWVDGQPSRIPFHDKTLGGWTEARFGFRIEEQSELTIFHHGGITLLPVIPRPEPGDGSQGFRIMDTEFSEGNYKALFQGRRASKETFRLWVADGKEPSVDQARLVKKEGNTLTYEIEFMDVETDYTSRLVSFQF
jgi:glycogen debranching enzyme